jgi:hypothetical protein
MPTVTNETLRMLDEIIERYRPGGEFGKPEEALLKRAKVKSLAGTAQDIVSSGLSGTTVGAGAGQAWEEEVGMPARLRLEDIRTQRLTEAMGAKAGYMERMGERAFSEYQRRANLEYQQYQERQRRERESREASRNYMQILFPDMYGGGRAAPVSPGVSGGTGATYGGMGESYAGGVSGASPTSFIGRIGTAGRVSEPTGGGGVPSSTSQAVSQLSAGGYKRDPLEGIDTTGWTEAEIRAQRNYIPGVSGYDVRARKRQQAGGTA